MSKFKVGDRVKCIKEYWRAPVGTMGTIRSITTHARYGVEWYGVEWDINVGGHTLNDKCKKGCGEWMPEKNIELISQSKSQQIFTTRKDNRVISIIKENGKEISRGEAKCCPEDEFDFKYGVKLATERAFDNIRKVMEFKVGDKVKVRNWGKGYSTYAKWFKESDNMDLAPYYRYDVLELNSDEIDSEYTIKAIYPHSYNGNIIYAICQRGHLVNGIYLIEENGLERIE